MKKHVWRGVLAVSILIATIVVFVIYFVKHPSVRHQLGHLSPDVLILLLLLALCNVSVVALITIATLKMCNIRLSTSESFLLTAYSAIINFFGPLQSGPAFRALYLKKKHDVNIKEYAVATIIYYFFYALFSCLFLLSGVLKWWLIPLIALAGLAIVIARHVPRIGVYIRRLPWQDWALLGFVTFLQMVLFTLTYYAELHAVLPGVHLSQAIVYSGAANLALFVSLTPGAIGFRESFLVFSQHLHHINDSTIVAANIIDRSVYIIVLLVLAVFIFGTHASQRLRAGTEG